MARKKAAPLDGDPALYMATMVDPSIADFEANPTSGRHAFTACVTTFHTVDYITRPKKPGNLPKTLGKECPSFATVDRVAHAFKHAISDGCRPLRANDVIGRPPGVAGAMEVGLSRLGDAIGGITLNGERELDLLAVVKRAAAFLRGKIAQGG